MHTYVSLVTLLSVFMTLWFSFKVGGKRGEFKAPATTGNPEFERANRVHMNTVEQLVLFLPSLWLALPVLGDLYTAAIGGVWLVGRLIYAFAYWEDASKRSKGMMITFLSLMVLFVAAMYGVVMALL